MLNLKAPTPMEQDDGHTDEWSHMNDYDDIGLAPGYSDDIELDVGTPTPQDQTGEPNGESGIPFGKMIERTRMLEDEEDLGRKIVRNNRVGTTRGVYDNDGTTHVDCESSAEGTTESSTSSNEIFGPSSHKLQNLEDNAYGRSGYDAWRHAGLTYFVASWSTTDHTNQERPQNQESRKTRSKTINCSVRGSKPKKFERRKWILKVTIQMKKANNWCLP